VLKEAVFATLRIANKETNIAIATAISAVRLLIIGGCQFRPIRHQPGKIRQYSSGGDGRIWDKGRSGYQRNRNFSHGGISNSKWHVQALS
jgi:hypothetical protein